MHQKKGLVVFSMDICACQEDPKFLELCPDNEGESLNEGGLGLSWRGNLSGHLGASLLCHPVAVRPRSAL